MSSYRRAAKLAMGMFQNLSSSKINTAPCRFSIPGNSTRLLQYKQYHVFSSNPIASNKVTSISTTTRSYSSAMTLKSKFSSSFKRFCNGSRNLIKEIYKGWFAKSVKLFIASGVFATVYYLNVETVPYTKRTRFILLPTMMDKLVGESLIQHDRKHYKIVPEVDRESVRLRWILKDIIVALDKGVINKGDDWYDVEVTTKHLDGLKWEILLVDRPKEFIYSVPGKIVVDIGILQHFKKDSEIATLIAHEVGHVVARHMVEKIVKKMWHPVIESISWLPFAVFSFLVPMPDVVNQISHHLEELPRYRERNEFEADHIGLMLIASAGYDPRIAPEVYKKLESLVVGGDDKTSNDPFTVYPPGEKRVQLLSQDMAEALDI